MDLTTWNTNRIHPLKFGLWTGLAGITMMFVAFTSAYIVRQSAGNWVEFNLPRLFYISTFVILSSSLTLHMAYRAFLRSSFKVYRQLLFLTLILGILFLVLQYKGWLAMADMGIYLDGNPSGSFIYVISGVHAAHVLGGVAVLIVAVMHSLMLGNKRTNQRILRLQLTSHYWHFVDVLWIYLLIFFNIQF